VRVQADAKPAIAASVGTIEGLHRARDGIWEAQYVPPDDAIPQVAILTAAAGGEVAWLAIPLWAEGDAVVKTRPRGRISVDIGSQTFGPVVADAHGNAVVPVVVPPGVYEAHHGKRIIPLRVPPSRTIHVAFGQTTLTADRAQTAIVYVVVVNPPGEDVAFETSAGQLTATASAPGEWDLSLSLEPAFGERKAVEVRARGAGASVARTLPLVPGPLESISFDRPNEAIVADGLTAL